MEVRLIENGTVVDHIPPAALFKIIGIMGLDRDSEHRMTIGTNLESGRMGTKAIIKIADRYPVGHEIDRIALFAPEARVNTIRDFRVVEKRRVEVPSRIEGFVRCANPMCITNHQAVETAFEVVVSAGADSGTASSGVAPAAISGAKTGEISLKCRYCEKITSGKQMEVKK
ncbi:MAG: aspartate carbamoyltransferase regulatory subunit [Alistipes sp.]|jgi:aspartate carbamoyltransferase regulatory subunit|nr:aspartate carbamoyltransferase regulatory subunit [Alistipes sp.]